MNSIKFRCYSKSSYHMYYPEDNIKCPNLWDLTKHVDGGEIILEKVKDILSICIEEKDKNKKDIYVGDIVEYIPILYMEKESYGDGYADKPVYADKKERSVIEYNNENTTYIMMYWQDCEVIGNIYEDPELLEEIK